MKIKASIRSIPNWPIEGVIFRDLTTLMLDPAAFAETCGVFYERYKEMKIDKIVGIDARGFVFGAVLAHQLNKGFVPVRKKGKLPHKTVSAKYALEYGTAEMEMHQDAIDKGDRVLVIDDLMATGGTIEAATSLVTRLGGEIVECAFVVELPDLNGRKKIEKYPVFAITQFEGE
jgi:adenine phosphoribosyltransferase